MNKLISLIACFSILFSFGQVEELRKAQDQRKNYISRDVKVTNISKSLYVNPFIGTGGHGHTYPGATAPFGMMQLSPDTRYEGWDGCSGYHYSDSIIYGFSHTHLSGTGVPDYCDLLIVPQSGKPKVDPGYSTKGGYGSKFSHDQENARPGYYDVKLLDENIDVRLTVSEHSGMHAYTFNNPDEKRSILIDLDHRDRVLTSDFEVINKSTIQGYRTSQAWADEQHFYFHLETSIPFKKAKRIKKNGRNKLLLIFPKGTSTISLKVGMSAVDQSGAQQNVAKEIPHWEFNQVRAEVTRKWDEELNRIQFESTNRETMITFYTALYHSFLAPNLFSDVDGRYRGRDNAIHQLNATEGKNYTVFSLWDTYRATHPLYTLVQQDRTLDFLNTFERQFDQGGDLPVWELAGNETECMIGYHSVSVIADAFIKGLGRTTERKIDRIKFLNMMVATSNFDEFGKLSFGKNGYIDIANEPESVSKTLEYAYDDFCISAFSKIGEYPVGLDGEWTKRSFNFINSFDPSTKFMRARRSGQWFSPFDPAEVNFNYTEANSWQYSLYAPHAVGVIRDLLGGKDSLEVWLDRLFTTESNLSGRHQVDITGLIGQYAHGNEPSHHMAYLYNYTNAPHKTQYYVHRILNEMYSTEPDGLSGNEDCGQMSSWYVLSSMGIYQIAPGNPYYEIGRPIMEKATIHLENGKSFIISTKNNSATNKYVQYITLNGERMNQHFITHDDILAGGTLEITMGSIALIARQFAKHAPTLSEIPLGFVPIPFIEQESRVFDTEMMISLGIVFPTDYEIFYTLDNSSPDRTSLKYTKPFLITKNTTLKTRAFDNNFNGSSTTSNEFVKRDTTISLQLFSEYANQYAGGGDLALIDGISGGLEFRTGDWQGFWAQDIVMEVNFSGGRSLTEIGIGCLSDIKSWIFMPREIIFEGSMDGTNFELIGKVPFIPETSNDMAPHSGMFKVKTMTSEKFQKIRITVKNSGKCPSWHLGDGNDTWLFVDELILK